jgi:hypothetical protein
LYKTFSLFSLIFVIAFASSCNLFGSKCKEGEGDRFEQVRSYETINAMETSIPVNIHLSHDPSLRNSQITVVAQENIMNNIFTKVENHKLTLDFIGCLEGHDEIDLYVESPDLRSIVANSPSRITAENALETDSLYVEVKQSSNVDLFFVGHHLQTVLDGSGDIHLKGRSTYLDVDVNSNMTVYSYDLQSDTAFISTKSNKDLHVFCFNWLEVEINGLGDVYYKEEPEVVQTGSGSGTLIQDI